MSFKITSSLSSLFMPCRPIFTQRSIFSRRISLPKVASSQIPFIPNIPKQLFSLSSQKHSWERQAFPRLPSPLTMRVAHASNEAIKGFDVIQPEEDLHTLGGNPEALDMLGDLVRYLQDPNEYVKSGVNHPKGVIISGPPGVGKTHAAKAVAGHAGVSMILISAAEFEQRFVGDSEKLLRELFKTAQSKAPCLLCIDEIDSVGSRFTSEHNPGIAHHVNSIINQLLTLLGNEHPGVVVIGTTNHYGRLDPALVRPGRFDQHIAFPFPNSDDRQRILEIHTEKKKLGPDVSLKELARVSSGFSGAKLAAWVNKAALYANKRKSPTINWHHFDLARTLLDIGVLRKNTQSPAQQLLAAGHEAGHAIVGHVLDLNLYKLTIYESGDMGGYVEWIPEDRSNHSKEEALNLICTALAGRASEIMINSPQIGSRTDIEKARAIIVELIQDGLGSTISGSLSDIERIMQQEMDRALFILNKHRPVWERIRHALVELQLLNREQFIQVFEGKSFATLKAEASLSGQILPDVSPSLPPTAKRKKETELKKAKEKCSITVEDGPIDLSMFKTPFFITEKISATLGKVAAILDIYKYQINSMEYIMADGVVKGYRIYFESYIDIPKIVKKSKTLQASGVQCDYCADDNSLAIYESLEILFRRLKSSSE